MRRRQGSSTVRRVAVAAVVVLGVLGSPPLSAASSNDGPPSTAERHCVLWVDGVDDDGALVERAMTCDDTAMEAATRAGTATRSGSFTIGRHFTGTGYSGSSITIVGSVLCGGGVWKPSGFWNNNIESTLHYCGSSPTRFYNSSTCGGSSLAVFSARSSLGSYNNITSCVRYG
jgi:hypothetical protein